LIDAPGASPRRRGTPNRDIDVLPVNLTRPIAMRPRPHWGQGWRKGENNFQKQVFYKAKKKGFQQCKKFSRFDKILINFQDLANV
jgi:hypothetical protein